LTFQNASNSTGQISAIFYPRGAMLSLSLLSSRVRLSVCHTPVLYLNG